MYNKYDNDCSKYSEHAEWLRIPDILSDWCKADRACREVKELAILGACENGEIEYIRSDGKTFDDPVMELHGQNLLLINKQSFNHWKAKIDTPQNAIQPKKTISKTLLGLIDNSDSEYISINEAIEVIHRHIGTHHDSSKAVQILNLAIGGAKNPPRVYKKDDFKGWLPVVLKNKYNGDFMEVTNPSDQAKLEIIHYLIGKIMDARKQVDFDDELPF